LQLNTTQHVDFSNTPLFCTVEKRSKKKCIFLIGTKKNYFKVSQSFFFFKLFGGGETCFAKSLKPFLPKIFNFRLSCNFQRRKF